MVGNWINSVFDKLKNTSSYDTKKIDKKLNKNKEVDVTHLTSKRFFGKGSDGHYTDDDATVASLDEYSGDVQAEVPSTAVDKVKYDPKTNKLWVKFVAGATYYLYERVTPQIFKSFMAASSKGRFVQKVLKPNHQAKKGDY